jgi:hypothetical protein
MTRGNGESLQVLLQKCLAKEPLSTKDLADELQKLRPDVQRTSINAIFSLAKSKGHIVKCEDGRWQLKQ